MKRITVIVALLIASSCDKPANNNQASSDENHSIAFSGQVFRNEMLGPELRKAIDDEFHSKARGIGMVCKRENFYIIAVDLQPEKQNIADEKGLFYLLAIPLIDKDGRPYWKLNMFAINLEDFLTEYGKLNGSKPNTSTSNDQ
jgi:hypothetical protein